jgi:hypothetical protein
MRSGMRQGREEEGRRWGAGKGRGGAGDGAEEGEGRRWGSGGRRLVRIRLGKKVTFFWVNRWVDPRPKQTCTNLVSVGRPKRIESDKFGYENGSAR